MDQKLPHIHKSYVICCTFFLKIAKTENTEWNDSHILNEMIHIYDSHILNGMIYTY